MSFGGYGASGGAECLDSFRKSEGAVGSGIVDRTGSAERSGTGSIKLDSSKLELSSTNQSQVGGSNALRPIVPQPRRPLPSVPRYEEITPRRGYQGEHWPNDLLHGDFDNNGYHYVTNTEKGARKKHSFHSMSTVRLEEIV